MPLNKLKSLDSDLKSIDAEHLDVNVPADSETAQEIKDLKTEGVSLEDIKASE
jgi:hypothetical protein